ASDEAPERLEREGAIGVDGPRQVARPVVVEDEGAGPRGVAHLARIAERPRVPAARVRDDRLADLGRAGHRKERPARACRTPRPPATRERPRDDRRGHVLRSHRVLLARRALRGRSAANLGTALPGGKRVFAESRNAVARKAWRQEMLAASARAWQDPRVPT